MTILEEILQDINNRTEGFMPLSAQRDLAEEIINRLRIGLPPVPKGQFIGMLLERQRLIQLQTKINNYLDWVKDGGTFDA